MSLLAAWVETTFAEALGWTLFHSLWEGILVAVSLAVTLAAVRSARIRYAAACLAMAVMLAGFIVTLIHVMPEKTGEPQFSRAPVFVPWRVVPEENANNTLYPDLGRWVPWLAPLWMAGVWIFYLRHAAGWISLHRLRRRGVCSAPESWQRAAVRMAAELRISKPVTLLESALAEVPIVFGHFRPVILMPVGLLTGLPSWQLEAILLHELAHVRRHDYLVNICQRLAEGLFFYHPAVWWISRIIRVERENCCDDIVVALRGNAHEYAIALTALEQARCANHEPAMAATGGSLMKRVRRLLYPQGPSGIWAPLLATLILIVSAAMTLSAFQADQPQRSSATQSALPETSPFAKWLNQDVVYIIDDKERVAFERFSTDDERKMFIEQFWLRRDPTPNTPQNEYKEEHYRRIAYANERFGTNAGKSGWQTDLGHMYIVYGPPDEIESHPSSTPTAYQVWFYRHVEGIGDNLYITFVDRTHSGDYRLAPGKAK